MKNFNLKSVLLLQILFLSVLVVGCSSDDYLSERDSVFSKRDDVFIERYCSDTGDYVLERYDDGDGNETTYKHYCKEDDVCLNGFCQNPDNLGYIDYPYCSTLDSQHKISMSERHGINGVEELITIRTKCFHSCVMGVCY